MANQGRITNQFLEVSLLGPFRATLDHKLIIGFKTIKARALLSYLMVERDRPLQRETLACMFWPEISNSAALGNLRDVLSNLRRLVGDPTPETEHSDHREREAADKPFFVVTRSSIQFNQASNFWLDVQALTTTISQAANLESLEQAVSLYQGNFGEDLLLKRSSPFDEWILIKREQISRLVLSALQNLANGYETCGDYEKVKKFAQKQLEIEPWHEEAHRQLMRAQALSGERNRAIMQYEACRRLLWGELGVEPESETTLLFNKIRNGKLTVGQGIERISGEDTQGLFKDLPPPHLFTPQPKQPFVDRTLELSSLRSHLGTALEGAGKVAFIMGDVGSGKTTLAFEFGRRAMKEFDDLVAAYGQCTAHTVISDPYLPFTEILQLLSGDVENRQPANVLSADHAKRLWSLVPITARALVEAGPALIGTIIPAQDLCFRAEASQVGNAHWWKRFEELVRNRMEISPAESHSNLIQQTNLLGQVTRVLQAIARERPLLLIIDDLQWADLGTISLLFHLGRHLAGCRILILGVFRSTEVTIGSSQKRHPLEPVVHEFQRVYGDNLVDLDHSEGYKFEQAFLDTEPNQLSAEFRDMLYKHAKGNPLFTIELIRGLQERGDLIKNQAGEWIEKEDLDWNKLPRRVEAIIAERFRRIPEAWVSVLRTGSVEGESFTAEVAAQIERQDENEVIRYLSDPLSTVYRIVHAESLERLPTGRRLSRYRFGHILYQKYLYSQLDKIRIKYLHELVGNTLEQFYGQQAYTIASQLARHYEQADMPLKAVEYLLLASQNALLTSVNGEATSLFRKGLELLKQLPDSPEKLSLGLRLQKGLSESLSTSRTWDTVEHAELVEHRTLLFQQLTRDAGSKIITRSKFEFGALGNLEHSLLLAIDLYKLSQQFGKPEYLANSHFVLGESLFISGECAAARRHLEQALALNETEGQNIYQSRSTVETHILCLAFLAMDLWVLGYPDQAMERSKQALQQSMGPENSLSRAFSLIFADITLRIHLGQMGAIEDSIDELISLHEAKELGGFAPWLDVYQGWFQANGENKDESIGLIQRGINAWQAKGTKTGLVLMMVILTDALQKAGNMDEAMCVVIQAKEQIEKFGLGFYEAELDRIAGKLTLNGDPQAPDYPDKVQKATGYFLKAIATSRNRQMKTWELRAAVNLAQLWQQQGKGVEAHQLLADVYGWFTEGFDTPDLLEAKKLLDALPPGS